jgi:hypothetical protein
VSRTIIFELCDNNATSSSCGKDKTSFEDCEDGKALRILQNVARNYTIKAVIAAINE